MATSWGGEDLGNAGTHGAKTKQSDADGHAWIATKPLILEISRLERRCLGLHHLEDVEEAVGREG